MYWVFINECLQNIHFNNMNCKCSRELINSCKQKITQTVLDMHVANTRLLTLFFFSNNVYISFQPNHLPKLKHRMEEAIAHFTLESLTKLWEGSDFTLGVCRVIKSAPC